MRALSDTVILEIARKRFRERYHLEDQFVVEEDPMWQNAFLEGYREAQKEAAEENFLGTPQHSKKGGRSYEGK